MNLLKVFRYEVNNLFSDIAIVLTIFGGVILYSFLYPQPYISQSVSSLKISVVDLDRSDISRDIIFKLNATAQVDVSEVDLSIADAKKALVTNRVKAILVIPQHFKRDLALNVSPTIALGADSSYFLVYGGVVESVMKSVLTKSASIKIANLLKHETPLSGAKKAFAPYSLNTINLFNPQNSYTQYVIPAVFVLILQQTLLIGLGILGGGINERAKEVSFYANYVPIWMMLFSRVLIFGSIFFIHILFYFGFSFELFGITHLASISNLLSFALPFLLSSIFLGIFLGSLFNSREIATPAILFSSLPLIFSVGFIWPLEAIPTFIHSLAYIIPSTPAIDGFLRLNQMGGEFKLVMYQYLTLWIQTLVYFLLAYFTIYYKRKQIKYSTM